MTEANTTTETFISPKDLAEIWGTDPKSVRRFLRANTTNRAGKGGRWEISIDDVEVLTAAYNGKANAKKFSMADVDAGADDDEVVDLEVELDDIDDLV